MYLTNYVRGLPAEEPLALQISHSIIDLLYTHIQANSLQWATNRPSQYEYNHWIPFVSLPKKIDYET